MFSRLKNKIIHDNLNIQVDLVQEYIKVWAWEGRKPTGFDQFYVCAKQMRKEEIPLRSGVDVIVTDSPLLLQCFYAKKYGVKGWEKLIDIVNIFEEQYPSLHIFLERGERPYISQGRYQNHEEAKEMDEYIKSMLKDNVKEYSSMHYSNMNEITDLVMSKIIA